MGLGRSFPTDKLCQGHWPSSAPARPPELQFPHGMRARKEVSGEAAAREGVLVQGRAKETGFGRKGPGLSSSPAFLCDLEPHWSRKYNGDDNEKTHCRGLLGGTDEPVDRDWL